MKKVNLNKYRYNMRDTQINNHPFEETSCSKTQILIHNVTKYLNKMTCYGYNHLYGIV